MKSLRRTGRATLLARIAQFFQRAVEELFFGEEERAAAPASSSDCARAAGIEGSRRTPREGEAASVRRRTLMASRRARRENHARAAQPARHIFRAVSGKTRLRCSTQARRDSRMRSSTVPVLRGQTWDKFCMLGRRRERVKCEIAAVGNSRRALWNAQFREPEEKGLNHGIWREITKPLLEAIAEEADAIASRYFSRGGKCAWNASGMARR